MHVRCVREATLKPAKTVGGRLRQVREVAGWTQGHMAMVIGKSLRSVKGYEADEVTISEESAKLWAKACGCKVSDLAISSFGCIDKSAGERA